MGAAALLLLIILTGCSQQPVGGTASVAAVAAPVALKPEDRLKTFAWNTAWAEVCGFRIDAAKMKSAYLAYEANNGAAPETVTSLASAFDRLRGPIKAVAASKPELCTEQRLERIRASVARYLANDFAPGDAV